MKFHHLKNWHRGNDCVLVGGGPSAAPEAPGRGPDPVCETIRSRWIMACNRADAWNVNYLAEHTPDFVVIIDAITNPVWEDIKPWNAPTYFTPHTPDGRYPPRTVQVGNFEGRENAPDHPDDLLRLPTMFVEQCPFYAIAIACYLGFETVGVIGVDFTEDRFPKVDGLNRAYAQMVELYQGLGHRIINLSPDSRCDGIPQGSWEEIRTK